MSSRPDARDRIERAGGSDPSSRAGGPGRHPLDAGWRLAYRVAFRLQRLYWWAARPRLQGAYVAVWHRGRVLCVENSYRRRLSLPAGGLARGEGPRAAAVRELREEVGLEVDAAALRYVGEIVSRVGHAEDHAHFFEWVDDERAPQPRVDAREVVWAGWLEPADVLARGAVDVVRQYLERHPAPGARRGGAS